MSPSRVTPPITEADRPDPHTGPSATREMTPDELLDAFEAVAHYPRMAVERARRASTGADAPPDCDAWMGKTYVCTEPKGHDGEHLSLGKTIAQHETGADAPPPQFDRKTLYAAIEAQDPSILDLKAFANGVADEYDKLTGNPTEELR